MATIIHGSASGENLAAESSKTQVYGLAGNDLLTSDGLSSVLLIGGSGDDSLVVSNGDGTLSGGDGADTFVFNYSDEGTTSIVIQDIDPATDKIIINVSGDLVPQFSSVASGSNVVLTDNQNRLSVTLNGVRENDYFDGTAHENIWQVLELTSNEREAQNLSWLTLADGLMNGASVRAEEIVGSFSHWRPDETYFSSVLDGAYANVGENIAEGQETAEDAVAEWMNSPTHRANILNSTYQKLGVGYNYVDPDPNDQMDYWVQLFADHLNSLETVSTAQLLRTSIEVNDPKNVVLTEGNDTYDNIAEGATIAALGGNDTITNSADYSSVSISGGNDNDSIDNSGANSTLDGNAGADTISNYGDDVLINGGAGDDEISNGGDGGGANSTINGDDGADFISNWGTSSTVNAGAGNDSIDLSESQFNLIEYASGDGNDTIWNFDEDDTLKIGDGTATYSTQAGGGSDVVVNVGNESILLVNAAGLSLNIAGEEKINKFIRLTEYADEHINTIEGATIAALAGNDTITNGAYSSTLGANVSISGGADNDSITNYGANSTLDGNADDDYIINFSANVSINGGADNDSIRNYGASSTINAGTGNDSILNWGDNVSISGGAGDDSIYNRYGTNVLINGGAGNDSIVNWGDSVSISGGAGNDSIDLSESSQFNLIEYASGDGNDTITGFDEDDTLKIGDGTATYSTQASGASDIIVKVGNESILLVNAAGLSSLNIAGKESTVVSKSITLTEGDDIYSNTIEGATIAALAGNDSIVNSAANVSISGAGDNDTIENTVGADNVTVDAGAGDDRIIHYFGANATIIGGDGSDWIESFTASINVNAGTGNDTVWIQDTDDGDESEVYVTGNEGDDVISNVRDVSSITLSGGDGNDTIENEGGTDGLLRGGDGNDSIHNGTKSRNVMINGDKGNDTISNFAEKVTVEGGAGDDYLGNTGKNVSISGGAGNDTVENEAANVTINAGAGVDSISNLAVSVTIDAGADNDYVFNSGAQVSIFGAAGNDSISNSSANVTINAGANDDQISLSGDGSRSYIQYSPGDGNDTIWGIDTNSTLRIFADSYTSIASGRHDIIYKVGDETITLKDARERPPHVVLGASDSTGGKGSGGGESGGGGTGGGTGGGGTSGGGTSGGGTSGGGNDSGVRTSTSTRPGYTNVNPTSAPTLITTTPTSTPTTPTVTPAVNTYTYTGGNMVISTYQQGEKIIFGETYTGAFYDEAGNLIVGSSTGALAVTNAPGKVVDLVDAAGNAFVKTYAATTAGVIDGRGLAGFELINGSTGSDIIQAGNGGSQLWGGLDTAADALLGGNGTDVFVGGKTYGSDSILNAATNDLVHLNDSTLSDIVATAGNDNSVAIAFNTGNIVTVQSTNELSAAVMLADGSAYRYNHVSKSWQQA